MRWEGGKYEVLTQGKYEIIHDTVMRDNNLMNISKLCKIAGVSRSGYYAWLAAASSRQEREESDRAEFDKILDVYKYRGYAKGARSIHMHLLHRGTRMNLKKIHRLMNKYGLKCPFRRPNPYKQMAKAIRTNTVFPNVVARDFVSRGARKVLLTDITYISYNKKACYLSTILDAFTHEVLAFKVSPNLQVGFVLETVKNLIAEHGCTLDDTTIIHSDQGCHYTSKAFIEMLHDNDFVQSMSRKGNCWDNAPQESFFGHMKDEIKYAIAMMRTYDEVSAKITDWMDYYNNERYQWDLAKLSPAEFFRYTETGIYPLANV